MTRQQIISHFGGVVKAADSLGYSRITIWTWRKGVPLRTQLAIEQITNGALKAQKRPTKK